MRFRIFVLMLASGLLLGAGCAHECKVRAMRCNGNKVELCYPDHKWKTVVNCDKLHRTKQEWRCARLNDQRCTCKPVEPQ